MKVICDRIALNDALNLVTAVAATRTPSPVLRCVRISTKGGSLALAATDLEVGLRLAVDQVDVQKEGESVVPADKVAQIVRSCEDPTITLDADDHALHIRSSDSHFRVNGYDPKEFPPVREFGEATVDFQIDAGTLQTMVQRTLFAAAAEHSRYAINGVLLERQGKKLRMVATDGRRLAVARGECKPSKDGSDKITCIIPTKALNLLVKLINDPDVVVRLAIEENQLLASIGDGPDAAVLSSNLVEGAFPPFEDVIPKDQDKKVTVDATALGNKVRQAALLTNEESRGVRLSFADKKLTLTSRAPEMGEAEIQLDLESYQGDPVEIGFNPSFITDALKVVDHGPVIVELKAPNKPGVLKAGTDFTYVLMPVNLQ